MRRVGLAAVMGAGLALSMPPLSWWPLALVAVVGLALACRGAPVGLGATAGGAFGLTFMVVAMWWLRIIVPGLQFLLAPVEAVFYAALGAGLALTSRSPGWPLWAAGCWAAAEVARSSVPLGGFPWLRLGTAFVDTPVLSWVRYVGEGGLTFVVALAALLIAAALVSTTWRAVAAAASAVLLLGVSVALPVGTAGPGERDITVAVVQGDVPGEGLESFSEPRVTLHNHVEATRRLAADVRAGAVPPPDVVVWPENASDIDPLLDSAAGSAIQSAVDAVGVPVIVGAVTLGERADRVQGTGLVWQPGNGPTDRYAKRRLVPFGEWVPMRDALTALVPLLAEETPRDFVPGDRPGVLDVDGLTVGAVMCFEVAYDGAIRDVATSGVDLLAVQTNNAFYMGTAQLDQQWAITRLRAVETGRAIAVAATTGISGVIGADGEVVSRSEGRAQQVLVATVPAAQGTTPGVRWGAAVEAASALLGVGAVIGAVIGAVVRSRGRHRV